MKYLLVATAALILLGLSAPASADMFPPSSSCHKPYKPYKFTSEYQVRQFESDVQQYKRCISDFVDEQKEEAQNHSEAADRAIEEWNRFVRLELS
jgi:hypothetical protein